MPQTISVVIPTYNYGRFIAEAVRSVEVQTLKAHEIIVVDDGSDDDTEQIVSEFGDRVTYMRQENKGVCAARNLGVERSSGELIAFLDADDIWDPTKLEKQSARFSDTQVGLVHCGMRVFDDATGETISLVVEGAEEEAAENLLLWKEPAIVGPGGTIMVSREAIEAVGGFDTKMKVGEDWDLCYRIARHYKVGFVPEPLVNYRSHAAAAHRNVGEMERGMSMFLEKAFKDPAIAHLKREAYGNLHKVMAGSYFHAGNYGKFVEHSARSVLRQPSNLGYFLRKLRPSTHNPD